MNTPKISIIVPVYKAEKYLHRCVDSILAQTFTDFEVLLVDDGSPDKSGCICDEFARQDDRVKVFHKENGGASDARNKGLEVAKGDIICFVDSDDSIDKNYLEIFLTKDADMVVQGFFRNDYAEGIDEIYSSIEEGDYKIDDIEKFVGVICKARNIGYLWARSFKRKIIEKNALRLNANFQLREDEEFILRYMLHCETFATINKGAYHYDEPINIYEKYKCIDPEQNLLCTISIIENMHKMVAPSSMTLGMNVTIMSMSIFNFYRMKDFDIKKIKYYTSIYCFYYEKLKSIGHKSFSKKARLLYYFMGMNCPDFLRKIYHYILS